MLLILQLYQCGELEQSQNYDSELGHNVRKVVTLVRLLPCRTGLQRSKPPTATGTGGVQWSYSYPWNN